MLQYKRGNLLDATEDIIAHGCNCIGAFGAGVALAIRHKWPEVWRAYLTKHHKEKWHLGDVQLVHLEKVDKPLVANLATQKGYGYAAEQRVFVDYDALRHCFACLFYNANGLGLYNIAIPKIGAGLGGGDWNKISQIIEEEMSRYHPQLKVTVYEL